MLMLSNVTSYNTIGRTLLFNHGVNARVRTKSIIIPPDGMRIRSTKYIPQVYEKDKGMQNSDQFICAALGKPFTSNCSRRKATGNHFYSSALPNSTMACQKWYCHHGPALEQSTHHHYQITLLCCQATKTLLALCSCLKS